MIFNPVTMCGNCGLPVHQVSKHDPRGDARRSRGRTTVTGWDHWGFWQGVRCPGRLTGAVPGRVLTGEEYQAWLAARLE